MLKQSHWQQKQKQENALSNCYAIHSLNHYVLFLLKDNFLFCLFFFRLRWWLHDLVLPGWNFNRSSRNRFDLYDYMGKWIFITARRDRFPPGICIKAPADSHWVKNVHKRMKFYKDICLLFSRRYIRRKNAIEITTISWNLLL